MVRLRTMIFREGAQNYLVPKGLAQWNRNGARERPIWLREWESNPPDLAYEANQLPLLYPAISIYIICKQLKNYSQNGTGNGTRTHTAYCRRILSPLCLPVPPYPHILYSGPTYQNARPSFIHRKGRSVPTLFVQNAIVERSTFLRFSVTFSLFMCIYETCRHKLWRWCRIWDSNPYVVSNNRF